MSLAVAFGVLASSTPLDDFLNGTNGGTGGGNAELVRDIGATMSMAGVLLALGVVVFLARVHRGPVAEVRSLLLVAGFGAVAVLTGAVAELAGIQSAFDTGWSDVLSVDVSSAAMLRLIAGILLVLGLGTTTEPVDGPAVSDPWRAFRPAGAPVRWLPGADSAFGMVGLALGIISFSFDGHTVTKGPRGLHLLANVVHVTAAGVWAGGVAAIVAVAVMRHRSGGSIAELLVRFSSVATVALVTVTAAGAAMGLFIIDDFGELTDTVWGRRLIIKLLGVAVAAALGGYHHLVTVPRLERPDGVDPRELARARTTLVVEALALGFVVIATGMLVNGSIT